MWIENKANEVADQIIDQLPDSFQDDAKWLAKKFLEWWKGLLSELKDIPFVASIWDALNKSKEDRRALANVIPYTAEYVKAHPEEFRWLENDADFRSLVADTSERLNISPNFVTAMSTIESSGNPYAERFEQHVYDKYIKKWETPERAKMLATSYWEFQIMWFNYETAGFNSVEDFVANMKMGNRKVQMDAYASFIENDPKLLDAMQKWDLVTVAKRYNGPQHAKNNYVGKLEKYMS